jgi:hypothetical protein|tara:strand:+ start:269 stop:490 length:222 start_codon:yes stop_codon:yes gene_type:complete
MKIELTEKEILLISECLTAQVVEMMDDLTSECSNRYVCNRFDPGMNSIAHERDTLENLVAKALLLLKITEEEK